MTKQPRRIGIADVASRAGVSLATVSRVMNGSFTVDRGIAARVRAAAEELQYHPNPLGRSLALGKSETIGVLVPDLANPMFQAVLRGVSMAAARDGYRVLIADSSETLSEEHVLASDARRRGDGVVLCAPRMSDEELEDLAPSLQPMVLINRTFSGAAPTLTVDYADGIRSLAEHLFTLGHRRLAFLSGPESSASNRLRLQGLEQFTTEHPEVSMQILPGGVSFASGHGAVHDVLATKATGILAFNDLVAMGLLSGLHEQGVSVPGEISVTGFDDIEFSAYTSPPLTTAAVPLNQLGEQAWQRLHGLLQPAAEGAAADESTAVDGGTAVDSDAAAGTVFPTTLQVRGSTGPVPTGSTAD